MLRQLITRELGRYYPAGGQCCSIWMGLPETQCSDRRGIASSEVGDASKIIYDVCRSVRFVKWCWTKKSFICRRCDIGIPKQMATRTVNSEITHFEDDVDSPERSVFPDAEAMDARIDVASILEGVSPLIAAILIGIYVEGEKVQAIARRLKISRFRVHRELRSFRTTFAVEPNPNKDQKRLQPKIGRKG